MVAATFLILVGVLVLFVAVCIVLLVISNDMRARREHDDKHHGPHASPPGAHP